MYTHTIAIAKCLLTEGRIADVDQMISPLVMSAEKQTGTEQADTAEVLFLKCLLAQARLFGGAAPAEVLQLFAHETDLHAAGNKKVFESAIASLSIGMALVMPDEETQNLPRALHLFRSAEDVLLRINRSDYLHWAYLGEATALLFLGEQTEADARLNKAATCLQAIRDRVATQWLACLQNGTTDQLPALRKCLAALDLHAPSDTAHAQQVFISDVMQDLMLDCRLAAEGTAPILIQGEPGAGKETAARLIHALQAAPNDVFIHVDCAGPADTWEAAASCLCAPDAAADYNITLFLNHIEKLSKQQQTALIDYFTCIDEQATRGINRVRLISASSTQLDALVQAGQFDAALYHRLKICLIEIPPLRMRKQDIPILALHFSKTLKPAGVSRVAITENALSALLTYDWPGNIRQLKNEIERILVHICIDPLPTIDTHSLSRAIKHKKNPRWIADEVTQETEYPLEEILHNTERTIIERVLEKYQGQVSSAAQALGLTRQGLYKKLKRLGIRLTK